MEKFSWKMGGGGAWKMPRTDAFNCPESKMEMGTVVSTVTATETDHQYHLMRNSGRSSSSSSCLVSENSNSTASEAIIFGHESSSSESSRLYRSESVPFHLHHYKPAGMPMPLPLCFPPVGREMGMVAAVRSPFSSSQWRELEQQALIFKYMTAGITVPADLLNSFRKSLPPFAGSSPYHHLPHTTLTAWSPFQMGYGGNVDPEPGRCRRTDGKKWRCSRDVVPDQKYCERHMHRGRHRGSRKPVEGPTGTTTSTTSSNLRPGRKDLSFSSDGNQFQHFSVQHAGVGHGGPSATLNETKDCRYLNGIKGEDDILSAKVSSSHEWRVAPKYNGSSPQLKSLMGQQFGLMREGNQAENFDAKQHQHSFLGGCSNRRYGNMQESGQEERPLRHFLDDWPRSDTEETSRSKQNNNSSTTQLSISIPSATNSWSPRGKLSLSPLKLTMSGDGNEDDPIEMDPIEMGLGVGMNMNMDVEERHDRPHSWIPIAWENNPMGMLGPLAEVLQSGGNKPGINIMEEDSNNNNKNSSKSEELRQSPGSCIASSPTGVLQKTFGCVSDTNSAATSKTDSSSQIASS